MCSYAGGLEWANPRRVNPARVLVRVDGGSEGGGRCAEKPEPRLCDCDVTIGLKRIWSDRRFGLDFHQPWTCRRVYSPVEPSTPRQRVQLDWLRHYSLQDLCVSVPTPVRRLHSFQVGFSALEGSRFLAVRLAASVEIALDHLGFYSLWNLRAHAPCIGSPPPFVSDRLACF